MMLYMTEKMTRTRNKYLHQATICPHCHSTYNAGKRKCTKCKSPLITVDEGIEDLLLYYWKHGITTHFSCIGKHKFKSSIPSPRPRGTEDGTPYLSFTVPQVAVPILKSIIEQEDECQRYVCGLREMKIEKQEDCIIRAFLHGYDEEIHNIEEFPCDTHGVSCAERFTCCCRNLLNNIVAYLFLDRGTDTIPNEVTSNHI